MPQIPLYIYLDWNIIKYMKEPRLDRHDDDQQMMKTVLRLKKKYIFPFSDGHMQDRLNNFSEAHIDQIKEDFNFLKQISDNYAVGFTAEGEITIGLHDIDIALNERIEELKKPRTAETISTHTAFPTIRVDMERLSVDHPMYEHLKKCDGILNTERMDEFLLSIYNSIFTDNQVYKRFRTFVSKENISEDIFEKSYSPDQIPLLNKLLCHLFPFIESFSYDEDKLSSNWKHIILSWASFNNPNKTQEQLINLSYGLLDIHPLFQEKLKGKKNTLDNIRRDGINCMLASRAAYFVSEDSFTREKAKFIYKAFGINTKVVSESEFLSIFFTL